MPAEPHDVQQALQAAVKAALAEQGELATRFVLVAEAVNAEDGKRALYWATSDEIRAWEALGMLEYGVQREKAQIMAAEMRALDED